MILITAPILRFAVHVRLDFAAGEGGALVGIVVRGRAISPGAFRAAHPGGVCPLLVAP